jgi:hypothetical protein
MRILLICHQCDKTLDERLSQLLQGYDQLDIKSFIPLRCFFIMLSISVYIESLVAWSCFAMSTSLNNLTSVKLSLMAVRIANFRDFFLRKPSHAL